MRRSGCKGVVSATAVRGGLPLPRSTSNLSTTTPLYTAPLLQKQITLDEMNSVAGQQPAILMNSNCGNVTDSYKNVWNNCDISIADEKRAILEWLSPLEPRERHQAIGMDRVPGVGEWLLHTSEFIQWNQGHDRSAKPVLFCYGDPGVGKTFLRYGWRLPLKIARVDSNDNSSLVTDRLCD